MAETTPLHTSSDPGVLDSAPSQNNNFEIIHEGIDVDRAQFTAYDVVQEIWKGLRLPEKALGSVNLTDASTAPALPSSYRIGCLAQSFIALSALGAALIHSVRNGIPIPRITVPRRHATVEFKSVEFCSLEGRPQSPRKPPVLGLHKTADGHIRIHDAFPNHRDGALTFLGLPLSASRADVAAQTRQWRAIDLETAGLEAKLALYALRPYSAWDALPQAAATASFPVSVQRIADGAAAPPGLPSRMMAPGGGGDGRCLGGLRVLELTRVIAGPLAGRTLAAHGADVLWVTSPRLPALPAVDRDLARGKRSAQLDARDHADMARLLHLVRTCDVFVQGYRPGSVAALGLSEERLVELNPGVVVANMSAFGPDGPWAPRRGFDSLVQTCAGANVSEAEHFGGRGEEPARVLPCQALDHGSGYLLATGILAALHRRAVEGGAYRVDVSLAGTMKYLRSLGQYEGRSGFDCPDITAEDVGEFLETRESGFGPLTAVRHSARVEGCETGWERMPKPLGSDKAEWLS